MSDKPRPVQPGPNVRGWRPPAPNPYVRALNLRLENMTAREALNEGLVKRVVPEFICGSVSPGKDFVVCDLEPGHDLSRLHEGPAKPTKVCWGPTQEEIDSRAQQRLIP